MNDRRRDLRRTAEHVSRASLEVRWTARDLRAAGHAKEADEMDEALAAMEQLQEKLYLWAPVITPVTPS